MQYKIRTQIVITQHQISAQNATFRAHVHTQRAQRAHNATQKLYAHKIVTRHKSHTKILQY